MCAKLKCFTVFYHCWVITEAIIFQILINWNALMWATFIYISHHSTENIKCNIYINIFEYMQVWALIAVHHNLYVTTNTFKKITCQKSIVHLSTCQATWICLLLQQLFKAHICNQKKSYITKHTHTFRGISWYTMVLAVQKADILAGRFF